MNTLSAHDHGNCEPCDEIDRKLASALEELAALREQIAKRDAELAALKGYAEKMRGLLIRTMPKLTPADEADLLVEIQNAVVAYRAAYPKE